MKKDQIKIILCQLTSSNDIEKNNQQIQKLFLSIPNPSNIDLISLPENSFFMRLKEGETVQYLKPEDSTWDFYKKFAIENNLMIHIGASPIQVGEEKFNATVIIKPDGSMHVPYKKIHLFDIHLEDKIPMRESNVFKHGEAPHIEEYLGWKMGFTICYDLRFSELYLYYQLNDADIIFIPSAFLVETGRVHWDILNRARAIEGQCFVVSAAQGGRHSEHRSTFGHSLVVNPWGEVLREIQDTTKPSFIEALLDKRAIQKVRTQIPMKGHRRLKVEFP